MYTKRKWEGNNSCIWVSLPEEIPPKWGRNIIATIHCSHVGTKEAEANARRICQCVNGWDELQQQRDNLLKACKGALAIKQLWLYPMSKSVTIQQRDEARALWIMQKQFEQAIAKAEK